MKNRHRLPVVIASLIAMTGAHFLISTVMDLPWLTYTDRPPVAAMAVSALLTLAGACFLVAALRGTLEPAGESVREVRKRALEKVATRSYLVRVAENDPDPEVRKKALEQIHEMDG